MVSIFGTRSEHYLKLNVEEYESKKDDVILRDEEKVITSLMHALYNNLIQVEGCNADYRICATEVYQKFPIE